MEGKKHEEDMTPKKEMKLVITFFFCRLDAMKKRKLRPSKHPVSYYVFAWESRNKFHVGRRGKACSRRIWNPDPPHAAQVP